MKRKSYSLLSSSAAAIILAKVLFAFGHRPIAERIKPRTRKHGRYDFTAHLRGQWVEPGAIALRESQHLTRRGQRRHRGRLMALRQAA